MVRVYPQWTANGILGWGGGPFGGIGVGFGKAKGRERMFWGGFPEKGKRTGKGRPAFCDLGDAGRSPAVLRGCGRLGNYCRPR